MAWLRERSGDVRALAVAIEIPHGPVVEALLEAGIAVYAINPKAVDRFRDRHSVAGAKDDRRDAFVLAEALHTDRAKFTRVQPPDATTLLLREVGRTYDALQHDRTCFRNRLRELAQRAYPDLLPLCPAANAPWFWDLLEGVTTKRRLRRDWVTRLLARHRKRAVSVEAVLAAVRTPALALTPGTYEALALAIGSLVAQLRVTETQRRICRQRLATLVREAGPTAVILQSHAGIDVLVAAALLGEAPRALARPDLPTLRLLAGTAPVTRRSGKSWRVGMRRSCNHRLRTAVRHWARANFISDPYGRAFYDRLRARGHSHERALRGLAARLLSCLVATLREGVPYDPERRQASLARGAPA